MTENFRKYFDTWITMLINIRLPDCILCALVNIGSYLWLTAKLRCNLSNSKKITLALNYSCSVGNS